MRWHNRINAILTCINQDRRQFEDALQTVVECGRVSLFFEQIAATSNVTILLQEVVTQSEVYTPSVNRSLAPPATANLDETFDCSSPMKPSLMPRVESKVSPTRTPRLNAFFSATVTTTAPIAAPVMSEHVMESSPAPEPQYSTQAELSPIIPGVLPVTDSSAVTDLYTQIASGVKVSGGALVARLDLRL